MADKENNRLIIIPTYNESGTITDLIKGIFKFYPEVDILIVDDNSPDGTGDIIEELSKSDDRVNCLHRQNKEGIGPAYIAGFKWAISKGYEYIMQMDADFSHSPEYVPRLFGLVKDHDVVIGSRYIKGGGVKDWGIIRRIVSRCGSLYAKMILAIPVNDLTGGFKCFKIDTLKNIGIDDIITRGYAFQIETTFRAYRKGARIKEFPIVFTDRRVGGTKMTGGIFLEAVFAVLKLKMKGRSITNT